MIKSKKLALVTVSAMLAFVMAGCGKSSSQSGSGSSSDSSDPSSVEPVETLTAKEAAAKALSNVGLVSEQDADYVAYDTECSKKCWFGEDSYGKMAKQVYSDEYGSTTDFFKHLSNGKLVAVVSYDDGATWMNSEANPDFMAGMQFQFDKYYYGAENLISAVANDAKCVEATGTEAGTYGIGATEEYVDEYNSCVVSADILFTLGGNGALDHATITLTTYYDYTKKADGTYKTNDSGYAITYNVINVFDSIMTVDPYNIEQYYATSWGVYTDFSGSISEGDTISSMAGTEDPLELYFGSVLPETADIDWIDSPEFHAYLNGEECEAFSGSIWDGVADIYYSALDQGDYTIVVSTALYSLSFTLSLSACEPTSFGITNYTNDLGYFTERDYAFDIEDGGSFGGSTYVNTPIYLQAFTSPDAAGGTVVATCDDPEVTIETSAMDYYGDEIPLIKLSSSVAGIYTINLSNSDFPDGITCTYDLTVNEAVSINEVVSKKYIALNNSGVGFEISFAPDAEDASVGEVTIVDRDTDVDWDENDNRIVNVHTNTYVYMYDDSTQLFELDLKSGTDYGAEEEWPVPSLGLSSLMLPIINSNASEWSDSYECVLDTPENRVVGTYYEYGNDDAEKGDLVDTSYYKIGFNEDEMTLQYKDLSHAEVAYSDDDDEYYFTNVDSYGYTTVGGYRFTETDAGYTILGAWEQTYCIYDENPLSDEQIFISLTLSTDFSTLKVTTLSGSFTLNLL